MKRAHWLSKAEWDVSANRHACFIQAFIDFLLLLNLSWIPIRRCNESEWEGIIRSTVNNWMKVFKKIFKAMTLHHNLFYILYLTQFYFVRGTHLIRGKCPQQWQKIIFITINVRWTTVQRSSCENHSSGWPSQILPNCQMSNKINFHLG